MKIIVTNICFAILYNLPVINKLVADFLHSVLKEELHSACFSPVHILVSYRAYFFLQETGERLAYYKTFMPLQNTHFPALRINGSRQ
jgi:hypothetical protein